MEVEGLCGKKRVSIYIYSAYGRAALLGQSRTKGYQTVVWRSNTAHGGEDLLSTQRKSWSEESAAGWPPSNGVTE
jgi:hypothetical protein